MGRTFWDPSEGLYGLFDVWRFSGFDSMVSSGLGGGSLIYANVLLRKDERWFVQEEPMPGGGYERWPISRADLDPHYDAVEKMLGATPYPLDGARVPDHAEDPRDDHGGREERPATGSCPRWRSASPRSRPASRRSACRSSPRSTATCTACRAGPAGSCGECDIGCNDGAKNTLDHTYLSAAKHHGADIRTRCEVRGIRPLDGGGYEVTYVRATRTTRPDDTTRCRPDDHL